MTSGVSQYLEVVKDNLRLDVASEKEILSELKAHIEDNLDEMKKAGVSEEEATSTCLKLLGSAKLLGRRIYEAHSQGSWRQALMASIPHFSFALVFVLNWWQGGIWLVVTLALILITAIYGWCRGKPIWLFPWLGYSLLPVVATGLLLFYLPKGWSWLVILLYIPLATLLVGAVTIQSLKKDWLYTALMLLPVPTVLGWFLVVQSEGVFSKPDPNYMEALARFVGLSFLALAIASAVFVRTRQRWLRTVLLIVTGSLTLTVLVCYAGGSLNTPTLIGLISLMFIFLIGPALMERRIRYGKPRSAR